MSRFEVKRGGGASVIDGIFYKEEMRTMKAKANLLLLVVLSVTFALFGAYVQTPYAQEKGEIVVGILDDLSGPNARISLPTSPLCFSAVVLRFNPSNSPAIQNWTSRL